MTDQGVRCPPLPRQHRHDYAAGFHHGLPAGPPQPAPELATPHSRGGPRAASRPVSIRFEPGATLRGVRQRFLAYTFSSLLAGPRPSDDADLSRRCQGRSHRPARSRVPAALSFTSQLRLASGGVLPPPLGHGEVGPGRPAGVATGGSPRTASRTRRAPLSAPGSPQAPRVGALTSCCARPRCRDLCSPVVVALRADSGRVEQLHAIVGGPSAVASA